MCVADQIMNMTPETRELVGFSLAAKVNGRVVRHAMREASAKEVKLDTIDALNDMMAELDEKAQSDNWFDEAGRPQEEKTNYELLVDWLHVKFWLEHRLGFPAFNMVDSFKFILKAEAEKRAASPDDIATMVKMTGMSHEIVSKMLKKTEQEAIKRTHETVMRAIGIVQAIDKPIMPEDDSYWVPEMPDGMTELLFDAIQSGKKAAIRNSRSTKDALASLIMLKLEEDMT